MKLFRSRWLRILLSVWVVVLAFDIVAIALHAELQEPSRGPQLLHAAKDAKTVRQGKKLYAQLCASCHGLEGATAGEAPTNLFDAKWYYGEKPEQIWTTLNRGIPEKGMPAWQGNIAEDDLAAVTAYLVSRVK